MNASNVALQNAQRSLTAAERGPLPHLISGDQQAINSANSQVNVAQQNLQAATLVTPVKGVVQHLTVFVGARVQAGITSRTDHAVVLFTPGAVTATGPVSDDKIRDVGLGDRVSVQPAGSSTSILAVVTQISPDPIVRAGVPTYDVTATLQQTNLNVFPGTHAKMTIFAGSTAPVPW